MIIKYSRWNDSKFLEVKKQMWSQKFIYWFTLNLSTAVNLSPCIHFINAYLKRNLYLSKMLITSRSWECKMHTVFKKNNYKLGSS